MKIEYYHVINVSNGQNISKKNNMQTMLANRT